MSWLLAWVTPSPARNCINGSDGEDRPKEKRQDEAWYQDPCVQVGGSVAVAQVPRQQVEREQQQVETESGRADGQQGDQRRQPCWRQFRTGRSLGHGRSSGA